MALAHRQSGMTQQDLISVGSIVNIKGRISSHRVRAISKDRSSAYISWKNECCWWPMVELFFVAEIDLFKK